MRNEDRQIAKVLAEARDMHIVAAVSIPIAAGGLAMLVGQGSTNVSAWVSMISLGVAGVFAHNAARMFGKAAVAYEAEAGATSHDGRPGTGESG